MHFMAICLCFGIWCRAVKHSSLEAKTSGLIYTNKRKVINGKRRIIFVHFKYNLNFGIIEILIDCLL